MPTIEVSAGAFTNFAYRLTFPAGVTTPGGNTSLELKGTPILGVFVNGRSVIRIYSGTRDSAWSASSAAIDANKLVEFISSTHYSTTIGPVISTVTGAGTLTKWNRVLVYACCCKWKRDWHDAISKNYRNGWRYGIGGRPNNQRHQHNERAAVQGCRPDVYVPFCFYLHLTGR